MSTAPPGLQPERTALAWKRTGLAILVVAALLLRDGIHRGSPFGLAACGGALLAAGLSWWASRYTSASGSRRRFLLLTAAVVCVTSALAVVHLVWTAE